MKENIKYIIIIYIILNFVQLIVLGIIFSILDIVNNPSKNIQTIIVLIVQQIIFISISIFLTIKLKGIKNGK